MVPRRTRVLLAATLSIITSSICSAGPAGEVESLPWRPAKPITVIVPEEEGSPADVVIREVAKSLEGLLKQRLYILNQPGDNGVAAVNDAAAAYPDGYTIAAGRVVRPGLLNVDNLLDPLWHENEYYLVAAEAPLVSVRADSIYKTFDDLVSAIAENPNEVLVAATSLYGDVNSPLAKIARALNLEYQLGEFEPDIRGRSEALESVLAGESAVLVQYASYQLSELRNSELRALAAITPAPLYIDGFGDIPSIDGVASAEADVLDYYGFWFPKQVPLAVKQTFTQLWETVVSESKELREVAEIHGLYFAPSYGSKTRDIMLPYLQWMAWLRRAADDAAISPDEVGIPATTE